MASVPIRATLIGHEALASLPGKNEPNSARPAIPISTDRATKTKPILGHRLAEKRSQ
jgi:hypothetical protein